MKRLPSHHFSEGPWTHLQCGGKLIIDGQEGEVLSIPAINPLLERELGPEGAQRITDKKRADIQLMAAAPDLLEMLEHIAEKLHSAMKREEQAKYGVVLIFRQNYLDELDSILEKARGPKS